LIADNFFWLIFEYFAAFNASPMAQVCQFCGTKPMFGNKVSHANNKTKRRWMLNLKRVRVDLRGVVKTLRLCTRCIRTGKFKKAV